MEAFTGYLTVREFFWKPPATYPNLAFDGGLDGGWWMVMNMGVEKEPCLDAQ